ncbi:MAG TPA: hypothetical protein VFQ35_22615 [Polyangiaceae bacterium]|nr:hypothetical protein [Polyangiaceae bacterium]
MEDGEGRLVERLEAQSQVTSVLTRATTVHDARDHDLRVYVYSVADAERK